MSGPLTPRRPHLSLRAYLVGLVLLCAVPAVAFSVWLTLALVAPAPTPWMWALGVICAAVLLSALGLAAVAGQAIIRSMTRMAETADDLTRDLEAAGEARDLARRADRSRDAQLDAIVGQPTVGIAQTDLAGHFVLVNARYCDLVGRAPDEVRDASFAETIPVADRPRAVAALRGLRADAPEASFETQHARPDGSIRRVSVNLSLAREAGEPRAVAIVALDATGRHVAEEIARARDLERGELLARERKARQDAEAASQAKDDFWPSSPTSCARR